MLKSNLRLKVPLEVADDQLLDAGVRGFDRPSELLQAL